MNLTVLCIGKLKERYWRDAEAEYVKRLSKYGKVSVCELKEARLPDKATDAEQQRVIDSEGQALLAAIPANSYVIALDVAGEQVGSVQLSARLDQLALNGHGQLTLIIGGSLGLSAAVLAAADWRLSFSALTFPHQLMRVILLEQLYRAAKISHGETYHK